MSDSELLQAVRAAAADEFDVLGEIARDGSDLVVFLAREFSSDALVALKLTREPDESGHDQYSLTVARELDPSIPDVESKCPRCSAKLRRWARFCTSCGADVSGVGPSSQENLSRDTLRHAVRVAAESDYDVLGEIPRAEGGGLVYFARDRKRGEIVALRLQQESDSEYALDVTRVLKPMPRSANARSAFTNAPPAAASRWSQPKFDPPAANHAPSAQSSPAPSREFNPTPPSLSGTRLAIIAGGLTVLAVLAILLFS